MNVVGLLSSLLPLLLQIPTLIKSVVEVTTILNADPATPQEVKDKLTEFHARLDEAMALAVAARLPAPMPPSTPTSNFGTVSIDSSTR